MRVNACESMRVHAFERCAVTSLTGLLPHRGDCARKSEEQRAVKPSDINLQRAIPPHQRPTAISSTTNITLIHHCNMQDITTPTVKPPPLPQSPSPTKHHHRRHYYHHHQHTLLRASLHIAVHNQILPSDLLQSAPAQRFLNVFERVCLQGINSGKDSAEPVS